MSAQLLFSQQAIPRTTTREQWRGIDRWRRITQRIVDKNAAAMDDAIRHLAFGHVVVAIDLMEARISPPLIIYPEPTAR